MTKIQRLIIAIVVTAAGVGVAYFGAMALLLCIGIGISFAGSILFDRQDEPTYRYMPMNTQRAQVVRAEKDRERTEK